MVVKQREQKLPTRQLRATNRFAAGGTATVHSHGGAPEALLPGNSCACATGCRNCPWVDFWDYDQCGVTSLHCSHMVGSPGRGQRG